MARIFPPVYKVKVIKLDGTVITEDLPHQDVIFTERLSRPGDQQLGSWSVQLIPARGANAYLAITYTQLDYMQRVEIYENVVTGQPVFSGQIHDLPTSLVGGGTISGQEWLSRLTQRSLRHYEFLGGEAGRNITIDGQVTVLNNIADQMAYLLKTWQPWAKYNFNGSISGDWSTTAGSWITETLSGYDRLKATSANSTLSLSNPLTGTDDDSFRFQVDLLSGSEGTTWERNIKLFDGGTYSWNLQISHVANEEKTLFVLSRGSASTRREFSWWEAPLSEWMTVDLWCYNDTSEYAGGQTVEVWLNGRQVMALESENRGFAGSFALNTVQTGAYFDNAILWYLSPEMQGTIGSTAVTDDTEYPGDKYLQALSALCDLVDWEWRTTARAGAGQDQIEIDETVGDDVSGTIRFEEGDNIISLSLTPTSQNLITHLKFKGQGQDQNQRLAEAFDFNAWDTYGIIEEDLSDGRISTNVLARKKCENELVRRKDGRASLAGSILETVTTNGLWRVGDTVWIKTTEPDLNRTARVVEVEYQTNSPIRRVTFDSFPRSRSGNIGVLMDDVGKINRGTKGNAAKSPMTYEFDSWWMDDADSAIQYNNIDPSLNAYPLPDGTPPINWFSLFDPELLKNCWGMSLRFTSGLGNYVRFGMWGSGFALISRTGPNLVDGADASMRVVIDEGTAQEQEFFVSENSAINTDKVKVFEVSSLAGGYHDVKLERAGEDNHNIYMALDAIQLRSMYWPVFIEGRAVNRAVLSWEHSKDNIVTVGQRSIVHLKINGVDVTNELGGPWYGSVTGTNKLNVFPYLSTPGQHSIELVLSEENAAAVGDVLTEQELISPSIRAALDLDVLL